MVADHLSQEYDLADMVGVMGELSVDGVDDYQGFVPDGDRFEEVFVLQGAKRVDQAAPALLPKGQQLCFGAAGRVEFLVSVAAFFFSVGCQEVGPAAKHIAMHVLDDDGDAVAFFGRREIKILFFQLGEGHIAQCFVGEEAFDRRIQVGSA